MILNRKALLDGEEQRKIGAVYMAAFFETALKGNQGYIPLFRDCRRIQGWLPDDIYINRFEDTTFRVLSDYDEDVDVTTTTLKGGTIIGKNLAVWREENLGFRRSGTKDNNVVILGWLHPESEGAEPKSESENKEAFYAIELPEGASSGLDLNADSVLVFSLAEADEKPPKPEDEESEGDEEKEKPEKKQKDKDEDKDKKKEPLEWSVELVTAEGKTARLPLSRFRAVPPILKTKYTKFKKESEIYGKNYEPTLQVFELELSDFVETSPGFHPEQLNAIRFVFDQSPKGVIILDRVGFANK
jgi:hypothetical protein